jgi:acyl-CoA synthetase (AMP-forming)/AMP-acid ligase II
MDLTEIEKCVLDIPVVDRVSVMVYKPYEPTQKILCYFTLKSNQTNNKTGRKEEKENGFTELSLKEKLKTVLPEYMMPNTLIKLKGMPLLVNGRFDRRICRNKIAQFGIVLLKIL